MLWEMTAEQLLTSFAFICCVSFIGGWLADRILGYGGFSVIGNWLILLLGSYSGLLVYNLMGYRFFWDSTYTMIVCIGSAIALLFVMLSVKTVLQFR